ncbi:hypothetical protein GH721_03815 [Kriegella sp. EG-1]|nr:hypothetical protein [Flavobacteriaceae bacterium EG-1]
MKKALIFNFILVFASACTLLPTKTMIQSKNTKDMLTSNELAEFANAYFWENYHKGNYHKIDSVLYYLQAAYIKNPNDLQTIAHIGFTNAWAISERRKLDTIPPNIVEHATLAVKYFGEAHELNSNDPRVLGFLADFKIIQGTIAEDKKLIQQGYFDGKKSINQWNEFNYFTVGYVLSQLPHDSWQFKKAIEWQWKTLDECYCEKVDRDNFKVEKYLSLEDTETNTKRKRACWNSWIAPHNVEGFYLNMGDMLVKSGDYKKGIKVYEMIKQVPQYNTWPFKKELQERIENAEINVVNFRKEVANNEVVPDKNLMMVNTSISCMSCHQMSKADEDYFKINDIYKRMYLKK